MGLTWVAVFYLEFLVRKELSSWWFGPLRVTSSSPFELFRMLKLEFFSYGWIDRRSFYWGKVALREVWESKENIEAKRGSFFDRVFFFYTWSGWFWGWGSLVCKSVTRSDMLIFYSWGKSWASVLFLSGIRASLWSKEGELSDKDWVFWSKGGDSEERSFGSWLIRLLISRIFWEDLLSMGTTSMSGSTGSESTLRPF